MALKLKNKTLRAAFLAAALAAGMGFAPSTAQAGGSGAAAASAAAAAANTARMARMAEDRRATNAVIADSSDQNIQALQNRRIIDGFEAPYVRDGIRDMKLPRGITPGQVTENQRELFKKIVAARHRVAIVSAPTPKQAVAKGLSRSLAPYFTACKDATTASYAEKIGYREADSVNQCMKDRHWENDTKPLFEKAGLGAAGVLLLAGAVAAAKRRV